MNQINGTCEFEIDDNDGMYMTKVGMILVWQQLGIVTDEEYWNLSCCYTGYKIRGQIIFPQPIE
jgi:hypothetical protein